MATAADFLVYPDSRNGGLPVDGIYLHIPFCFHKCHYCDFYSIVDTRDRQAAFTERMIDELRCARAFVPDPLRTVFVGGGTPTLLAADLWARLLAAMGESLTLTGDVEFTVEANPETVDAPILDVLRAGGVNRLSLGAQSFEPRHLKMLERHHDPASVGRAVGLARATGFSEISLDLIFGVPGQTAVEWRRDLNAALALAPTHLSCYGLTYEPNTALTVRMQAGAVVPIGEDAEAEMYEITSAVLAGAGFEQYEISNWARPGSVCRHNLVYWTDQSWWPIGPSAAGHVGGWRWKNSPHLGAYLESAGLPPVVDVEGPDDDRRASEAFMLGLRLVRGIALDHVEALLALGTRGGERREAIGRHIAAGLLDLDDNGLRLTQQGRLLANTVLADLV